MTRQDQHCRHCGSLKVDGECHAYRSCPPYEYPERKDTPVECGLGKLAALVFWVVDKSDKVRGRRR